MSHPIGNTGHAHTGTGDNYAGRDKLVKTFATIVGAVFLLVGIAGFIPGVTTDYDTMQFAGHESNAKLLGIFQVSILHNIVHLLFGVAGLAMARKASSAVAFLIGGGVIYLVLFVYGILVGHSSEGNFVPTNDADDYLHLVLGIGMIALGLIGRKHWQGSNANRTAM